MREELNWLAHTELEQLVVQPTGGNIMGCLAKTILVAVLSTLGVGIFLGVILFDIVAQILR